MTDKMSQLFGNGSKKLQRNVIISSSYNKFKIWKMRLQVCKRRLREAVAAPQHLRCQPNHSAILSKKPHQDFKHQSLKTGPTMRQKYIVIMSGPKQQ